METLWQHIQEILGVPEFLINQCTFLPEFIRDALITTVKFVPWLYFLYYGIELLERYFLKNILFFIKLCKKIGPLFGVTISIIPECGYQVIASTFYARKMITRGTLLAFFISCSDDAIPILCMDISKIPIIVPLIVIKVIVGLVVAYIVDVMCAFNTRIEDTNAVNIDLNEPGCCHHKLMTVEHPPYWWHHPILHTFNVFMFVLLTLIFINCLIAGFGNVDALAQTLKINSPLQVILGALFGLIPNSVTSIVLALAYVKGLICFPTLLAGLITNTGLGLYALSKYHKDNKDNTILMAILLAAGIITGLVVFYNIQFVNIIQDLIHLH